MPYKGRRINHVFRIDPEQVKRAVSPRCFYEAELIGETITGARKWIQARCPFHGPDRHPSFSINMQTGGFRCFACGLRGRDIIEFLMQRDGLTFRDALEQLAHEWGVAS